MQPERELLDQAEERVEHELADVRSERDALAEFREVASRVRPGDTDRRTVTTGSDHLMQTYRETVLAAADHEDVHGETIVESLASEFTPSIAETLSSSEPLTQRFKRDLLVEITEAIERRRGFAEILDGECGSIRTTRDAIEEFELVVAELPSPSLRVLSFEEFEETWERYDALVDRCERLMQERQSVIADRWDGVGSLDPTHDLNEYLYADLGATYPVLSALVRTRRRLEHRRDREDTSPPNSH